MAKPKINRKLKYHKQIVDGITKARQACQNLAILTENRTPFLSIRYEDLASELEDILEMLSELKQGL